MGLRDLARNIAGAITTDISVSQWKSKAAVGVKTAMTGVDCGPVGNIAKSTLVGGVTGGPVGAASGAVKGVAKEVVKDAIKN